MLPEAFLTRLKEQLGDEFDDYLRSLDRPQAVALRFNPLKTDSFPSLPFTEEPVPWADFGHYYTPDARPGLHVWHEAGLYYLQEASAMAPVTLLAPQPGEIVLDLCAAPGGKTTQIAALMAGRGLLVCNEINPKRAKILSRNIERMAVSNALVLNHQRRSLSSGVSSVSPLGVTLPTRISPARTSVPILIIPSLSRSLSASSPTLGTSRVIS